MIIVTGDIGATNSRLALLDSTEHSPNAGPLPLRGVEQFCNDDFSSPQQLVAHYLENCGQQPEVACFAIAAPVPDIVPGQDQSVRLTNYPWHFSSAEFTRQFSFNNVYFINDYRGFPYVTDYFNRASSPDQVLEIQTSESGQPDEFSLPRTELIFGAGTGLGCVIARKDSHAVTVIASEAGHCDISGSSNTLRKIIAFLAQHQLPLCWETLLSGPGIETLYAYVTGASTIDRDARTASDITRQAKSSPNSKAFQTVELFINLAGVFARNMALACLADEVYLVGNIFNILFDIVPVDIVPGKPFLNGFHDTTQHQDLLRSVTIRLLRDRQTGLKAAAAYAMHRELLEKR